MEISLSELVLTTDEEIVLADWQSVQQDEIQAVVTLRSVDAIVISQDCDATRAEDISFSEIRPFHEVERDGKTQQDSPKKWVRLITQQARKNQKWFYLPPDANFGLSIKSAVDLRIVLSVGLEDLKTLAPKRRVCRLNEVAASHFRERISDFYRRYPYDEWYPLDKEELSFYGNGMDPKPEPFAWQET
jgi:hypothetical protein